MQDMAQILQEIVDREGWAPGQLFSGPGAEDYPEPRPGVPAVYVHLPGRVVLKLKDLTDMVR